MSRREFGESKKKRSKRTGDSSSILHSEGMRIGASALFFVLSIYFAISLLSFLFEGGTDQHLAGKGFYEIVSGTTQSAGNLGGKFGAILSDFLINRCVGISALILCYIFMFTAVRIFQRDFEKFGRHLATSICAIIWLSLFLGCISEHYTNLSGHDTGYLFLGGMHGYYVSIWLDSVLGSLGTILLILFLFVLLLFFGFNSLYLKLIDSIRRANERRHARKLERAEERRRREEIEAAEERRRHEMSKEGHELDPSHLNPYDEPDDRQGDGDDFPSNDFPDNDSPDDDENPEGEDVDIEIKEGYVDESADENMPDYDPTLDLSHYEYPTLDLLEDHPSEGPAVTEEELAANKQRIVDTLETYNIKITKIQATIGPTVTLYEIVPAPGIKISKIKNLEDDIALSLSAFGIRIIAPIPGQGTVGIEVPNLNPQIVSMRALIASMKFQESKYALPVVIGRTISNEPFTFDLTKMPHLLVAGATGQGKSVGLNAIITSLLYKKHPSQLKFVMIDPKKVELSIYSTIEKHFLAKLPGEEKAIITETKNVINTLNSLCIEMENRYALLEKAGDVRTIKEYNEKFIKRRLNPEKGHRYLPYIVVVIDEFGDLIMTAGREIEKPICRIAQLARAVGIHAIIATQRPSTNIITGTIKANFPARIAFKVAQMVDSRTIIDTPGANQLIGRGDMLISIGSEITRIQCAFVDTPEVVNITQFIARQQGYPNAYELPEYIPEDRDGGGYGGGSSSENGKRDELFEEAARFTVGSMQGSTSAIQRRFGVGFTRAGRIMDQLEAAGIVGPSYGGKARNVLVDEDELEEILRDETK